MVAILMMSAKLTTIAIIKIKVFWNKGYYVIIYVHNVTIKVLLCGSNYIVHAVISPKIANSSIFMREVIITSIL